MKQHTQRLMLGSLMAVALVSAVGRLHSQDVSENEVARRQFENGRGHMKRGNYEEGLKDFRAVATSYPDSPLADNALLEISRYYSEIADDPEQAVKNADEIITKYPTSDSAPYALIVKGEVILARSRRKADLDTAVASFDRVPGIYPAADAVPEAQYLAAEALRVAHVPVEALRRYRQIEATFPTDPVLPKVHIGAGMALAATGDPVAAMEELQLARSDPEAREDAEVALARLTTLYRLYVKPTQVSAFVNAANDAVSRLKASDVLSVLVTPGGAAYFASKSAVIALNDLSRADPPPSALKPRGLAVDRFGRLVVIDGGTLKRKAAPALFALNMPQGTSSKLLDETSTALNLRNGDWLVAADDDRGIQRFAASGKYMAPFAPVRASRLAINEFDEIAALDRDGKTVKFLDETGKPIGVIPQRGTGYELKNPVDIAYDVFGNLYVLDRNTLFVFVPGRQASRLVRTYTEPENSPAAFRRAAAFALDPLGRMFIADDHVEKIRLYQ
jgi:outer membrane protein assembly factor BamD (BamD/ComL family)